MAGKFINRQKASSHPAAANNVYECVVKSVVNNRPIVFVKQLGCTYSDVNFVGNSTRTTFSKNDLVLCTFIDGEFNTPYVLGSYNKKQDFFVGKEKYNALIDALISQIGITGAALTTFNALKQND